jgi:GGDEF domain-containing protein
MTRALKVLLPGGGILLGALAFLLLAEESAVLDVAGTYGLVVYGAGIALAAVFHRSRAFIVLCIVAWLDIAIVGGADRTELLTGLGTVVIFLVGALAVVRDRGVASPVGLTQALVASFGAALGGLFFANPERVARFAARPEVIPLEVVAWPGYPRLTIVIAMLAFLAVTYGFHRYRGPVERSFMWVVVLLMVAMHPDIGAAGSAIFLVAAGLTVTMGVVETSYVMAYRDELTGLPGRRALMQYLDGIKGTCTIAMVDVDHFKKFNDRHGHDVGDQVLKLVASRLARTPGGGRAYRYGGEEFTLLFPGRTSEDALPYLEAVLSSIGGARFALRSWKRPRKLPDGAVRKDRAGGKAKHLSVTVSIGMAHTDGKDAYAIVLKRADQALYRAKKKGRNQVSK